MGLVASLDGILLAGRWRAGKSRRRRLNHV